MGSHRHLTFRLSLILLLGLLATGDVPPAPAAERSAPRGDEAARCESLPPGQLQDTKTFRVYVIRTYRNAQTGCASLEVWVESHRIYRTFTVGEFLVGKLHGSPTPPERIALGNAIIGRGVPIMVVSEWSGGAHCCYTAHLFAMEHGVLKLLSLEGQHGPLEFQDLDGDGILEVIKRDWTFAAWKAGIAQSPAPKVILRFTHGGYQLAPELMRKPPTPPAELAARATALQQRQEWQAGLPPPEVWGAMLDLIYSGNARQAWELLDQAWRGEAAEKAEFLHEFRAQLATSPYWPQIKAMNGE